MLAVKCVRCGRWRIFRTIKSAFENGWAINLLNDDLFCPKCFEECKKCGLTKEIQKK